MLACVAALSVHASAQFEWEQLPDFPGTARDDAAAFTIGSRIYVGTGMEVGWGLTNDWHLYDADENWWLSMSTLPAAPRQYCTAFTLGDKGYLFGGITASGAVNELWMYDPAIDAWQARAPLPGPGRYASVSYTRNGLAYVQGGVLADGSITNELWYYAPGSDEWTLLDFVLNAELPARHRSAVIKEAGFNIITCGIDALGATSAATYMQLGLGHEYIGQIPLPSPRFGARGAANVLIGGASTFAQEHDEVWQFRWAEGWNQDLPAFAGGPRRGGIAAHVPTGDVNRIYFGLGLHGSNRFKDWWVLNLPVGIEEHAASHVSVFPNPASDALQVRAPNDWICATFTINDMLGRVTASGQLSSAGTIDIASLSPGRYSLRMDNPHSSALTSFIKLP